jgi:RNA polymerase sigma-70 factor, ECF subfamily
MTQSANPAERFSHLLLRVQGRDRSAFDEIYRNAAPAIRRYVASAWSDAHADDVVQEVFRRFLERPEQFAGRSKPKTYLLGIARNVIRECRSASDRVAVTASEPMAEMAAHYDVHGALELKELTERIREARSALPKKQALAIVLAHDRGLTARQAAEIAGCTEKGFRCRLERATRKLRSLLSGSRSAPLAAFSLLHCSRAWLTRLAKAFALTTSMAAAVVLATRFLPQSKPSPNPPRAGASATKIVKPVFSVQRQDTAEDLNPQPDVEAIGPTANENR